jgi:hypothetical protein
MFTDSMVLVAGDHLFDLNWIAEGLDDTRPNTLLWLDDWRVR